VRDKLRGAHPDFDAIDVHHVIGPKGFVTGKEVSQKEETLGPHPDIFVTDTATKNINAVGLDKPTFTSREIADETGECPQGFGPNIVILVID